MNEKTDSKNDSLYWNGLNFRALVCSKMHLLALVFSWLHGVFLFKRQQLL